MKKPIFAFLLLFSIITQAQGSKITKQMAIDSLKAYYAKFETGSEYYANPYQFTNRPGHTEYRKITGNYVFEFTDCTMKLSWDTYNWPFKDIRDTEIIEIKLFEIDSIGIGPTYSKPYVPTESQEQGLEENSNSSIAFHVTGNKIKKIYKEKDTEDFIRLSDYEDFPIDFIENNAEKKDYFYKTDIVKYFKFLLNSCKPKSVKKRHK